MVGVAVDGRDAVDKVHELSPDVVTMDIQMPVMDGYEATREIMIVRPTPIVVISGSMSSPDVTKSMSSLQAGALTIVGKPSSPASASFDRQARQIVETVRSMSAVRVVRRFRPRSKNGAQADSSSNSGANETASSRVANTDPRPIDSAVRAVAIAASTGGPQAIEQLLTALPSAFPAPLLVVQHIAEGFVEGFARWLDQKASVHVDVAKDGTLAEAGHVYIAPEDRHLGIAPDGRLQLLDLPPRDGFRPSGSVLFESMARSLGSGAVSVILTGMGRDGVDGLRSIRQTGGTVIAQDEASSVVYGMPGAAAREGLTHHILPIDEIAQWLNRFVEPEDPAD